MDKKLLTHPVGSLRHGDRFDRGPGPTWMSTDTPDPDAENRTMCVCLKDGILVSFSDEHARPPPDPEGMMKKNPCEPATPEEERPGERPMRPWPPCPTPRCWP